MKVIFSPGTEVKAGYRVITGVLNDTIYVRFFGAKQLRECNNLYLKDNLKRYKKYYKYLEGLI